MTDCVDDCFDHWLACPCASDKHAHSTRCPRLAACHRAARNISVGLLAVACLETGHRVGQEREAGCSDATYMAGRCYLRAAGLWRE